MKKIINIFALTIITPILINAGKAPEKKSADRPTRPNRLDRIAHLPIPNRADQDGAQRRRQLIARAFEDARAMHPNNELF